MCGWVSRLLARAALNWEDWGVSSCMFKAKQKFPASRRKIKPKFMKGPVNAGNHAHWPGERRRFGSVALGAPRAANARAS